MQRPWRAVRPGANAYYALFWYTYCAFFMPAGPGMSARGHQIQAVHLTQGYLTTTMGMAALTTLRWLRLGIRQKIILVLASVLVVTLTLSTLLTLRSQQNQILEETHRRGMELSQLIAQNLAYSVVGYNYHTIELVLHELLENDDIEYVRVVSAKGNTMAEVGVQELGSHRVTFTHDIRVNNEVVGKLHVRLSTERIVAQLESQQRASFMRQFLVILTIMLAELAALSYIIVRPIGIISRALAGGATAGTAPQPIPISSKDEFGELATQFNSLHEQLDDAHRKLQSRVDLANEELQRANELLTEQANELRQVNRELQVLTVTDPLTGLYNRRHFEKLMENEVALSIRNDETNSIILIDIDHFKQVNDAHGHVFGDLVLQTVSSAMLHTVRNSDVACRYGGEEFAVILQGTGLAASLVTAERIRKAIAALVLEFEGRSVSVTISVGVATVQSAGMLRPGGLSPKAVVEMADAALYRAKRLGRNRVELGAPQSQKVVA